MGRLKHYKSVQGGRLSLIEKFAKKKIQMHLVQEKAKDEHLLMVYLNLMTIVSEFMLRIVCVSCVYCSAWSKLKSSR